MPGAMGWVLWGLLGLVGAGLQVTVLHVGLLALSDLWPGWVEFRWTESVSRHLASWLSRLSLALFGSGSLDAGEGLVR